MKRLALLTTLLLTLLSGLVMAEPPRAQANTAAPNLAAMPLMFIEQQPNRYQVAMGGQTMWLTHDSVWLSYTPSPESGEGRGEGRNIKLTFENANPQARLEPINRLETHVSYFIGNDPAKWQTDMPVYGGVRYHDLYPGQDLTITSEQGQLAWQWENTAAAVETGHALSLPQSTFSGNPVLKLYLTLN